MSQGHPSCRSMVQSRPRAPPQFGWHPIERARQCIRRSFCRRAVVGDNAPPALVAGSFWMTWTVGTRYASRHRFPLVPAAPSVDPKGWCGAGPSDVPPWGSSQARALHRSNPWTSLPALLACSDCSGTPSG